MAGTPALPAPAAPNDPEDTLTLSNCGDKLHYSKAPIMGICFEPRLDDWVMVNAETGFGIRLHIPDQWRDRFRDLALCGLQGEKRRELLEWFSGTVEGVLNEIREADGAVPVGDMAPVGSAWV